jgi:asparagine synthase (glutamine-hydrolysing)
MPGIAGIIQKASQNDCLAEVRRMVGTMKHEPFYVSGTFVHRPVGLCAGWTGFDPAFNDFPMWNEQRDVCLIFCGEHYADSGEIERLRAKGHKFGSRQTDSLVHLYEETGPRFFESLNGWFSGLVLDLREQKAILFNDRFGLNRLYYHEDEAAFYFSSEAKALLQILPQTRQLDSSSLSEFFSCGCVLQNRTLFRGISPLPPGSKWEFFGGDRIKRQTYFDKTKWENQSVLTEKDYYEKLKTVFPRILKRYLNGSELIGVSLTGGVDSRMMMAWADCPPSSLPCYTFGSRYRDSIDVEVARQVAMVCRQPHQVISVGAEFLTEFASLAERTVYITDGTMDVSGSADLFVNRIARQIAPIRLTGNYGGEILRELVAFKPSPLQDDFFNPEFRRDLERAVQTYESERNDRQLSFVAFKQVPWHHYSRLSLERSQLIVRSPYLDNEVVELAYQTPASIARSNAPSLQLIADGSPALGRIGTDRGLSPRPTPVVTQLRHLFQEFIFRAEYAYDYGMPQWLSRIDSFFTPLHLERLFLGRHKFHHFRIWYRNELAPYLKAVLLDRRTLGRPYLSGANLEKMVESHLNGTRNYTLEFHRILTSELIQRQLVEQS